MRNRRIIYISLFIVIIIATFFLFYKFLTIRQVVIIGNKNLTEKEIKSSIMVKEGSFILYPSSKEIYERLKKIAWIKDAAIRKDLNGKLTIFIIESIPIAILDFKNKKYLINDEGKILEELTDKLQDSLILLPIIKNIDPLKDKETLFEAVKLTGYAKTKGLIKSDDEVILTAENVDNLTININGLPIIFGKGEFDHKFSKYLLILAETQKRGMKLKYIDLRFPDRVIVKPLD